MAKYCSGHTDKRHLLAQGQMVLNVFYTYLVSLNIFTDLLHHHTQRSLIYVAFCILNKALSLAHFQKIDEKTEILLFCTRVLLSKVASYQFHYKC